MARVFRKGWLVGLLALGLVVSLLGVAPPEAAVGAHGDEEDIDFAPVYSACVGAATESAGFEDTEDIGAEEAIDCLFHYGITTGRSETMYAPRESVLRWQMALFMARAAAAAGIVLANPAEAQGFTDIGDVSEEAQNAINGLADKGIMLGTSQTTFTPNGSVNRGSMAMILDAFLREATPGTGAFGGETSSYADVKTDNTNVFTDVNTVSLNTYNAIFRIYELGVTKGVAEHQFQPAGLVTRGQMAAFITRAFSHTIARPAGVSVQGDMDMRRGPGAVNLIVSVRDTNFQPVDDAKVDVFRSADPDTAFDEDGVCVAANVMQVSGTGQAACEVDLADSATESNGDLSDLTLDVVDEGLTVWAWTGDRADKFDSDDTAFATFAVSFAKAADRTLVSDTLKDGQEKAKFGETVTVTIQIADEDGVAVPEKGSTVSVTQQNYEGTIGAMTQPTTSSSNSMTTDADGKIVLEFTQADPNTNTGDMVTVRLTLGVPANGLALKDEDGDPFTTKDYVWSDEASVPTNLILEGSDDYALATNEGPGAFGAVTATLTDQYGDGVRGQSISFLSDTYCRDSEGDPCAVAGLGATQGEGNAVQPIGVTSRESDGVRVLTGNARNFRVSGRDGSAYRSYNYDAENSVIETVWATFNQQVGMADSVALCADPPVQPCRPANDGADIALTSDRVYQYWVVEADSGDAPFTGRILVKDPENDRLVVAANEKLLLVKYDSNDQFSDLDGPTVMEEFEKPLEDNADPAAAHLRVTGYKEEAGEVSTFFLQEEWPSLNHPDGDRAGAGARFGQAVAADNGVIVVGAGNERDVEGNCVDYLTSCTETDDIVKAGMVYIYPNGMNTAASAIVKIAPPTATNDGQFGYDVDISGDTVVVGSREALREVYVYERQDNGSWTRSATLKPASGHTFTLGFGHGVAIDSDGTTIAVASSGGGNQGAIVIYERPMTGWTDDNTHADEPKLDVNTGYRADGRSVAISGDGNTVAGGSCAISDNVCQGWLYVYTKPDGGWVDRSDAAHANGDARWRDRGVLKRYSEFAKYVALSEDGSTLVVSNGFNASQADVPGSIRVYERPDHDDGWAVMHADHGSSMETTAGFDLTVSSPRVDDVLGQYIAIKSDGSEIASGRHYRQEGDFRGSVVTYSRPADGWSNDNTPDNEYLGPWVNAHLGWATTYDKSTGDLYSGIRDEVTIEDPPPSHKLLTVYQITR